MNYKTMINQCIATNELIELSEVIKPDCKQLMKLYHSKRYAGVVVNCDKMYVTNNHYIVVAPKPKVINVANVSVMPQGKVSTELKNALPACVVSESGLNTNDYTAISSHGDKFSVCNEGLPDLKGTIEGIDKQLKPTMKIGLNAQYLVQIAKYLSESNNEIVLEITSNGHAIRITGTRKDATGYLMPCRV